MGKKESRCAAPVARRIEVQTIWSSSQVEPPSGSGGHRFSVRLVCRATHSTEYLRARDGGWPGEVLTQMYRGDKVEDTFPVDPAALQSDDACRGAIRRMLMELPQLRVLHLTESEWDAIVPQDVVPVIVGVARGDDGPLDGSYTFCFAMDVHRRVIHCEPKALMMVCKEKAAGGELSGEMAECAICFGDPGKRSAVELPGCAYAYLCFY